MVFVSSVLEFSRVNVFKTLELVTLQIVLVVRAFLVCVSCGQTPAVPAILLYFPDMKEEVSSPGR